MKKIIIILSFNVEYIIFVKVANATFSETLSRKKYFEKFHRRNLLPLVKGTFSEEKKSLFANLTS